MTPDYLRSRFVYRDNASAYRLRNTENKLVLPQPCTDYLKRSFLNSAFSSPEPTIFLACGWDRELWPDPIL